MPLFGKGIFDMRTLCPRLGRKSVVNHPRRRIARHQHVFRRVRSETCPILLGVDQHVGQRLQLGLVGAALRNAQIDRPQRQHLSLTVQHVDLAAQFLWRVEQNGKRADIPGINIAVHRKRRGAPLIGDRRFTARIKRHIQPLRVDIAEVRQLCGRKGIQNPLTRHDADHIVAGHRHVILPQLARLE